MVTLIISSGLVFWGINTLLPSSEMHTGQAVFLRCESKVFLRCESTVFLTLHMDWRISPLSIISLIQGQIHDGSQKQSSHLGTLVLTDFIIVTLKLSKENLAS